jgi:hypothetical protein
VRCAFAAFGFLLVAQVAGGAASLREAASWTAYGHDAQLTNFVPSRVLTPKTAPRQRRVWSRRLDGALVASPLVARAGATRIRRSSPTEATAAASSRSTRAPAGGSGAPRRGACP